jgi:NAD(P)-dependent dehydrogenase (short-subunit alcohol dehydrogenase family)
VSVDLGLRNKVALVTGSASGIGEAIARRLASEGARLMVHGRPGQAEEAAKVAREINNESGTDADVELADVADPAACAALIDAVTARYGRIDILVNNAGTSLRADLPSTDAAIFDKIFAVNLRAPLLLIRAALPHFRKQGGGRVLNIGSINAYCGESALLAYSMSKGGLTTMTRNLADTYGQEGLRVNQLNPGWVLTDNEYRVKVAEGLSPDWPTQIPRAHAPGGRIFRPDEIAHFAANFLGVQAELVNGTVFEIEQFPLIGRNPVKASGF